MPGRMMAIGLDCFEPTLCFEQWADDMPSLTALRRRAEWGRLRSIRPPITVPAWSCMLTGRDPGELGIYGFRNRRSHDYDDLFVVTSQNLDAPTVWDELGERGIRCCVLSVPLTFPPKPLNGQMASCFLTPDKQAAWTYPPEFAAELDRLAGGEYPIDVRQFRTAEKEDLLEQIRRGTEARMTAAEAIARREDWGFFMFVEMGPDRIHHGFWRYHDRRHRLYEPGGRFEQAIHDYYCRIDKWIGRLCAAAGDVDVLIVSDHGAQRMAGAICINEWLQAEGYLTLKVRPAARTRLTAEMIDWPRTKAWGEGGYYGRVFLNVQGREPCGTIRPEDVPREIAELKARLAAIDDSEGRNIGTVSYTPQEMYRQVRGIPPDLTVFFGDLSWRSAGTVGNNCIHLFENDTGPDDANHAMDGMYLLAPAGGASGRQADRSILDIHRMILARFAP